MSHFINDDFSQSQKTQKQKPPVTSYLERIKNWKSMRFEEEVPKNKSKNTARRSYFL